MLDFNQISRIFLLHNVSTLISVVRFSTIKSYQILMKNTITTLMGIIFLMVTTACHSYIDLTSLQEFEANKEKTNIAVLQLQTDQLENIHFSEKYPGRIVKDKVVGIHQVILNKFNSDHVIYKKGSSLTPVSAVKDKVSYSIINEPTRSLVLISSDTLHIPLTAITKMHIKKTEPGKTLLVVGGVTAGVAGFIYLILVNLTFDLGW